MSQGEDGEQKGRGLDEEALREWVLKAYHEKALESEEHAQLLDAVRLFLSGATSRYSSLSYYFEGDPESSLGSFARQINEVSDGLAASLLEPIELGAGKIEPVKAANENQNGAASAAAAPNLSLYVSSLAGPIAMRREIDETVVCSLLSTVLLAVSRLGIKRVREALS